MRSRTRNPVGMLLVWAAPLGVAGVFGWILADLAWSGIGHLNLAFLTAAPEDAGRAGGVGPILVSTLLILGVCMGVAVPLGLGTSLLLAEFTPRGGRFGAAVRWSLGVLAGVPSIVFGLFGNALFAVVLGFGFSILSGGLTLACMVLPILIRTTEAGLREVPDEFRHGAAALGMSPMATALRIVLPAAAPALVVGLVLGIGRAVAETAALIFTSGYVARMPESVWDSGRALSVHIYDLAMNVSGGDANAYASALLLVALLLSLNSAVALLERRWRAMHEGAAR